MTVSAFESLESVVSRFDNRLDDKNPFETSNPKFYSPPHTKSPLPKEQYNVLKNP